MMRKITFVLMLLLIGTVVLAAQTQNIDALIAAKVKMVEEGKADQVRLELPGIVSRYQNHPGVLYLQGLLATNGVEAAKYYQMILDNFPKSEWADDALYRIHLYYYSLGLHRTAELKMQQLRKEYPNSPYIKEKPVAEVPEDEKQPVVSVTPPPQLIETGNETELSGAAYAIQAGAFASIENAMRFKSFFEELGYPVEVQNKVRGGRSLHLVWVGSFATADEARKFRAEIKSKHKIESIVVAR